MFGLRLPPSLHCVWLARIAHRFPPELICVDVCIYVDYCPLPALFAPPRSTSFSDVDAAAELTPALLVLNKLVLASEDSREAVKRAIFPPEADEVTPPPPVKTTCKYDEFL